MTTIVMKEVRFIKSRCYYWQFRCALASSDAAARPPAWGAPQGLTATPFLDRSNLVRNCPPKTWETAWERKPPVAVLPCFTCHSQLIGQQTFHTRTVHWQFTKSLLCSWGSQHISGGSWWISVEPPLGVTCGDGALTAPIKFQLWIFS